MSSACLVRRVSIPRALSATSTLSTPELIQKLDQYTSIDSFAGQVTVGVTAYFTNKDQAKEYVRADGVIRLRRPQNIGMRVSFISARIADMVSDGQEFKLAIYKPEDARQFVRGTNLKELERMAEAEIQSSTNRRLAEAGGLVNMRPQHITDAFLIKRPTDQERTRIFREEVRQLEEIGSGKKGKIERSYYVLYVLEEIDGKTELRRKFWFDRTQPNTPLVRQQIFENSVGRLGSDISYINWREHDGRLVPGAVKIDRKNDGYCLEIASDFDSLAINQQIPDSAFELPNSENLKEVNLDDPQPRKATVNNVVPKPKAANSHH